MRTRTRRLAAAIALSVLAPPACTQPTRAVSQLSEVVVVPADTLPQNPSDPAWQNAPELLSPLLEQDIVEPRSLGSSTQEVRVRALTDGRRLAVRMQWVDATLDELNDSDRFCDACAIQLPAQITAAAPAPQMGQPSLPVEIAYWSASRQAAVEGRGLTLADRYPNAAVDHYPFHAPSLKAGSPEQRAMSLRYAPARAAGNPVAGPHASAVEDLVAAGPGTVAPAPKAESTGAGQRTQDGWAVVIVRPLPEGLDAQNPGRIALAVWEGAQGESGSRKMRTGWIPLVVWEKP